MDPGAQPLLSGRRSAGTKAESCGTKLLQRAQVLKKPESVLGPVYWHSLLQTLGVVLVVALVVCDAASLRERLFGRAQDKKGGKGLTKGGGHSSSGSSSGCGSSSGSGSSSGKISGKGSAGGGSSFGSLIPLSSSSGRSGKRKNRYYKKLFPFGGYKKGKFRAPYYDKCGRGYQVWGYGGKKLNPYTKFKPLEGYYRK
ncbi:unnamed protein product [Cyprideis torosa]|uniref:Uncharacterized protein n=1 Tax=Cyprideis torosa TaxID=163714 RepID=A0A7R8ZNY0_9CRUS|nr:unnamed protein product [Cyprideis torosa]CAG0892600.1 unnamed protein product [Cyprideis torosa]